MLILGIVLIVLGAVISVGGLLIAFTGESEALFGVPIGLLLATPGIEILLTL